MASISDLIYQLPADEKQLLDSSIMELSLKKGQTLLNPHSIDDAIFYVIEGLMRKFTVKDDKELTLDFYFPDDVYFPVIDKTSARSPCYVQSLTNTTLYKIDIATFNKIKQSANSLQAMELYILEMAYAQVNNRLETFQTMNARERYLDLLQRNPKLVQQIPLMKIATYLGINNASLSKIRASLK